MIYKEPTIYKMAGSNSEVDIKKSVLEYADDWIDVSTDFSPATNAVIYKDRLQPGVNTDLKALLSVSQKLLYFNNLNVRVMQLSFDPDNWNYLLQYTGNQIKFVKDGGATNPRINNFVFPEDINRGSNYYNMVGSDGGSVTDVCTAAWTGTNNTNTFFSCKRMVDNASNGLGFIVGRICFNVDLF